MSVVADVADTVIVAAMDRPFQLEPPPPAARPIPAYRRVFRSRV